MPNDDSPKPSQDEINKEAAAGNPAAQSLGNKANPGLGAKARGIRGGVHWEPDPPSYSIAHDARKSSQ